MKQMPKKPSKHAMKLRRAIRKRERFTWALKCTEPILSA
jgi:hypothetical protein